MEIKIVNCIEFNKRKGLRKTTRERKQKGNKQRCDSVFSACASFPPVHTSPVRPTRAGTSRIKCGHKPAISNTDYRHPCQSGLSGTFTNAGGFFFFFGSYFGLLFFQKIIMIMIIIIFPSGPIHSNCENA